MTIPITRQTAGRGLTALLVGALLLAGCTTLMPAPLPTVTSQPFASHANLVRHYAPVIYQGAASDQDYITAVNFDGDWIGNNNWENQPTGDLSAYVYDSVIETDTHWYLFYALYHPHDYTAKPCAESDGCHENDMESLEVVVAKDGTPYGHPIALLTLAHSHIYLYNFNRSVRREALKLQGKATLEENHPVVWVETYGHGIHGRGIWLRPGKIIYRVGDQAERPTDLGDKDVHYQLVSIYDTLWQHRTEIGTGQLFDQPFDYHGHILPASFDGENWGEDKANAPWGYAQDIGQTLLRGDFFLDPAKAFAYFATVEGKLSQHYLYNPYLADLE